jgi:ethanolamine ammonia-lyase small subunit
LLIGERPGLARAESMSIYMGYRPKPDSTDANRDVICNIYEGGLNPLEAGALAVQMIQRMIKHETSGVDLRLVEK